MAKFETMDKSLMAEKQRLLRLSEKAVRQEITTPEVEVSYDEEFNQFWVRTKWTWSSTQFCVDIRVEKEGHRFVYYYGQERYEHENAVFKALARDIAVEIGARQMAHEVVRMS